MAFRGGAVGVVTILWGVKVPETFLLAVDPDVGAPPLLSGVPANALEPRRVVWPSTSIHLVLAAACGPQITPPIIRFSQIDVVDIAARDGAAHIQKSQPVGSVTLTVYPDFDIAISRHFARAFASAHANPIDPPRKHARLWVVMQQLLQARLA